MKTLTKNIAKILFTLSLVLLASNSLYAEDCSKAVDRICDTFDKMGADIKKAKSFDDIANMDFVAAAENSGLSDISDACAGYVLTSADKVKLKKSYANFINATAQQICDLSGGYVSRKDLDTSMAPVLDMFNGIVDESETLFELGINMTQMGAVE